MRMLLEWYARHGRDLPWRHTRDPYRIWVSEVILQQTRVAQGLDYYNRFTARFPDVLSLARASEDEVLKYWQGLGYYSRARNLLRAAQTIAGTYGGRFPEAYGEVRALPGIGDYTAAAVCSIAYGAPYAVLDGNVFRVLARLFDLDLPVDGTEGRRAFARLADELLDRAQPGLYNQAMMDFGALQCVPLSPDCSVCPLAGRCLGLAAGRVAALPVKRGKTVVRDRWFHYLCVSSGGRVWLHRRGGGDIWEGLYEFPLIETGGVVCLPELQASEAWKRLLGDGAVVGAVRPARPHILSHQRLHAVFYEIEVPADAALPEGVLAVPETELGRYAVPRLLEKYLLKR